jgi:hypothetical protein
MTATFNPKRVNEYWTEVTVSPTPKSVTMRVGAGTPAPMSVSAWSPNTFTSNQRVPAGSAYDFTATMPDGSTSASSTYTDGSTTPTPPPAPVPSPDVAALQMQVASLQAQVASLTANVAALEAKIQKARNDLA